MTFMRIKKILYKNIANTTSLLGVIPLFLLFTPDGYRTLLPLMLYNNFMDDLDGILANKLQIKSSFGAVLDNICDAVAHTIFVLAVGIRFGGWCGVFSLLSVCSIILRVTLRIQAEASGERGSPTNELIRHLFFILILEQIFSFNSIPFLSILFVLHAFTMLIPWPMPTLIRNLAKSVSTVLLLNIALLIAWMVPITTLGIGTLFLVAYLYSLIFLVYKPFRQRKNNYKVM